MHIKTLTITIVIALGLGACGEKTDRYPSPQKVSTIVDDAPAHPQRTMKVTEPTEPTEQLAADNSGYNVRDDGTTVTPFDQGTSDRDLAITQTVRKAVMAHKDLSTNGKMSKSLPMMASSLCVGRWNLNLKNPSSSPWRFTCLKCDRWSTSLM